MFWRTFFFFFSSKFSSVFPPDGEQANFYGVFSDNRPELAAGYYDVMQRLADVGTMRASFATWGTGTCDHKLVFLPVC